MEETAVGIRLVESGWDRVIDEAVAANGSELRIICPFIKKRSVERLLKAGRPEFIQVITRFKLADFYDCVSDISALRLLLEHGARIRGVRGLHAKVYLFGGCRAIVTSANLTEAALLRNYEFGFVAEDPVIVAGCRKYFETMWEEAGPDLALERLEGWDRRIFRMCCDTTRLSATISLPDEGVDIGKNTLPMNTTTFVEAPQAFVKFAGRSDERTDRATTILDKLRSSGAHWACTYPKGKRPRSVEDGAIMFMGEMVKDKNDTVIFGRAVAYRHEEGRDDATPEDMSMEGRSWKRRWPHYIRVHHGEFLASCVGDGVSLDTMMEELGSHAFVTTQTHEAQGAGNTNPRRTVRRQAAVQLTAVGAAWLNAKLDEAFEKYGKLGPAEMQQLDQPDWASIIS